MIWRVWEGEMTATTLDFCFDRMEYFASVLINPTPEWAELCLPVLTHCSVGGSGPSVYLHVTGLSFDWSDN